MFLLINMPHAFIEHSSLSLPLFKALFNRENLPSRVRDLNLLFARRIGPSAYRSIEKRVELIQLLNSLWGPYVWGSSFRATTEKFLQKCTHLFASYEDTIIDLPWLRQYRDVHIPAFLSDCMDRIYAGPPPTVIGFSCTFSQTLPALALGRLIKQHWPEIKLVYGGAAFHGEMGDEYIQKIDWIDAISTGEADDVVVRLFRNLAQGSPPQGLQGILYRDGCGAVQRGPAYRPISQEVFAALPDPDFDDFFEFAEQTGISADPQWRENVFIPFEGSRGCWWGDKSQCAFCGMNGCSIVYRSKPGKQIYKTLSAHMEKYQRFQFIATDTAMCREHFNSLLPRLARSPFQKKLRFYNEIRADISREQAASLASAGFIHLQAGIENLSTRILQLMRKGTRALQNVYFLKLCRQYGITPLWFYLLRAPGERLEDYKESAALISMITHLHPPRLGSAYPMDLYKFSPYFMEKTKIRNVRPKGWYAYQYPADRIDISRIAYMYEAEWLDTLNPKDYEDIKSAINAWCRAWTNRTEAPALAVKSCQANGRMEIEDTRLKGRPRMWTLGPEQAAVLNALDAPGSIDTARRALANGVFGALSQTDVEGLIGELMENKLVIREKKTYLSLVLPFQDTRTNGTPPLDRAHTGR